MELQFFCPHCGDGKTDDWELLDAGRVQPIRCDHCQEHFHLAVMECLHCAQETTFSWGIRPNPTVLTGLICGHCGRPFVSNDHGSKGIEVKTVA
jgi:transcription elongation factor Elf1